MEGRRLCAAARTLKTDVRRQHPGEASCITLQPTNQQQLRCASSLVGRRSLKNAVRVLFVQTNLPGGERRSQSRQGESAAAPSCLNTLVRGTACLPRVSRSRARPCSIKAVDFSAFTSWRVSPPAGPQSRPGPLHTHWAFHEGIRIAHCHNRHLQEEDHRALLQAPVRPGWKVWVLAVQGFAFPDTKSR